MNQKSHIEKLGERGVLYAAVTGIMILGIGGGLFWNASQKAAPEETPDQLVEDLVSSEEWITTMGGYLNRLAKEIEVIPSDSSHFFKQNLLQSAFVKADYEEMAGVRVVYYVFSKDRVEGAEKMASDQLWNFPGSEQLHVSDGKYFTTDGTSQHPALSVVDIDGDGFDDLYVCVRWGRNLLYRNQGDGTFQEVAGEYV